MSFMYSWEWRPFQPSQSSNQSSDQSSDQSSPLSGEAATKLPQPATGETGASEDAPQYRREGFDLSPANFQNYLLDLVNLSSITTSVGELTDIARTPIANWLRTQGLILRFSDAELRYILVYGQGQQVGQRFDALPEYLVRYLELLDDDTFTNTGLIPAYQALALLTYVITTERYRSQSDR